MWQKIKTAIANSMIGRHGPDQLSRTSIYVGLAMYILSWITKITLFSYIGLALYVWSLFRMFSRNREKRAAENLKYLSLTQNLRTSLNQAKNRAKNSKEYKYFRCPKCRSYLKLPRGVGEVTVTCGKCRNQFRKKA